MLDSIDLIDGSTGLTRKFYVRPDSSDRITIQQVFEDLCYDMRQLKRWPHIREWSNNKSTLIIDAGANVGASAVWFALTFPTAKIAAIEPEEQNYEILKRNIAGLNAIPMRFGLQGAMKTLSVFHPGGGFKELAFRTKPDQRGNLLSATVGSIFNSFNEHVPFIVKIDIEGSEKDVFSHNIEWIDRTPIIMVELHDWLMPEEGTSLPFLKAMSERNRDFILHGDTVISISNELIP